MFLMLKTIADNIVLFKQCQINILWNMANTVFWLDLLSCIFFVCIMQEGKWISLSLFSNVTVSQEHNCFMGQKVTI